MPAQTILLTSLPNGVVDGAETPTYRMSVVVSPRLRNDVDTTLADFPDWLDWPASVASMNIFVEFPDLGMTVPATVTSSPETARWTALFPSDMSVHGHTYAGIDHRRIWSYPTRNLHTFMRDRWAAFGLSHPEDHPSFDELRTAFGAVGFEELGTTDPPHPDGDGPQRKGKYLHDIEDHFDLTSDDPTDWSLPFDPTGPTTDEGQGKQFLMWERYHRRGRSDRADEAAPPDEVKEVHFHEAVALAMDFVTLPRLLGLVIDLEFPLLLRTPETDTRVRVVLEWEPELATPADPIAAPYTRCNINPGFTARPKNPADTDFTGRWLALSDADRFEAIAVDVDAGAARTRQFADNVTRSRRIVGMTGDDPVYEKYSDLTPDSYALPHHSSGGLQVVRVDKGTETAHKAAHHLALNGQLVDPDGDPGASQPDLYLEDLFRGYRWDIEDQGVWRSLMEQEGEYHFLTQGTAGDVPVVEEGVSGASASTAGGSDGAPGDLYVSESLMRWDGWSLANQLIGASLNEDQEATDGEPGEDPAALPFRTSLHVPPGSLPRLRFGRSYKVRGRAVDLAGNSEDLADTEPLAATLETAYHRYEPVESPTVLLRDAPGPGESTELVVIRSENTSSPDQDAGESDRHLVPPQSGQLFAEQHGVLDTGPGGTVDKAAYAALATLDAGNLGTHPAGQPDPTRPDEADSLIYPVDHLPLNYLADPMSRGAALLGLSGSGDPLHIPFETAAWPDYDPFRLSLAPRDIDAGDDEWDFDAVARRLQVRLPKADALDLRLSSFFGDGDLEKLGLWNWIITSGLIPAAVLAELRDLAVQGHHWMLTPWRRLRLVHAVRTPLAPPSLLGEAFIATKHELGQTHAQLQELIGFHLTSTGRVDVNAGWSMNIDLGPGTAPPSIKEFDVTATSLELERFPVDGKPLEPEPRGLDHKHEFGDTKHRVVAYTPMATSAFVEFFREETTVTLDGETPTQIVSSGGVEEETVVVETFGPANPDDSESPTRASKHRRAQPGRPATGDFMVDGEAGTIQRTPASLIPDGAEVTVSFVRPEIHVTGEPETRSIPSSARPAAPKPQWVLPTFGWSGDGTLTTPSIRTNRGVRIYLERPWWSSGDSELLGVVLPTTTTTEVPDHLVPYVSQIGFDPVNESGIVPGNLSATNFSAATHIGPSLPMLEAGDPADPANHVTVAGHEVAFDADRDMWYCDVDIDLPPSQDKTYWPFVRLGLCRYQPESLPRAHLSRVVMADFVQLAPSRTVSVITLRGGARRVTVTGRTLNDGQQIDPQDWFTSRMRFRIELQQSGASDPDLGWEKFGPRGAEVVVEPTLTDFNQATWTGTVSAPPNPARPMRLVVEELEQWNARVVQNPTDPGPPSQFRSEERISHVDVINLA